MRKSYVTTMPNHIGAFMKASECFADLGINITRVSYNKAIDDHTLFIDAEGTEEQLARADVRLREIGYLQKTADETSVVLLEFYLEDVPGTVTEVLRIISDHQFNISFISSQQNGSDHQLFKMGLLVDNRSSLDDFIADAEKVCPVRVIEYNAADITYDNSIFYNSFISGISKKMDLTDDVREELLVNSNLAMQYLDERGQSPFHTFDSIGKVANMLAESRGDGFVARITRNRISDRSEVVLIEPPCGSNIAVICSDGETMFVDTGYSCFEDETLKILKDLFPDFDSMSKPVFVTHADLDHTGLCHLFDEVLASENTADCLKAECRGDNGFREMNPNHKPYIRICKALTSFVPVPEEKIKVVWKSRPNNNEPLYQVGTLDFGEFRFKVYEGMGGHLKGETVLVDDDLRVAFTGDIYINMHGMTKEQENYNRYAPTLMTSVDTDPAACKAEREAFIGLLGPGQWKIFGGHGGMIQRSVGIDLLKAALYSKEQSSHIPNGQTTVRLEGNRTAGTPSRSRR